MICPNCGKKILDTSVYCNKCGMKVNPNISLARDKDISTLAKTINEEYIIDPKKSKLKKVIISLILLIVVCGSAFGGYHYVQIQKFNGLVRTGDQKLNEGNYDEAIQLYNQALAYKNDNTVQNEIILAKNYKQYEGIYNEGVKLMSDNKYLEAIQKFNEIHENGLQIYTNAQNKLAECKKLKENIVQVQNNHKTQSEKVDNIKNESNDNGMTQNQAIEIVADYSKDRNWNVVENTASEETIIEGSDNIIGHKCYFFSPKGGRVIIYVIDKTTGKLYKETDRLVGQNRVYRFVK